jgi:hypothetical protein
MAIGKSRPAAQAHLLIGHRPSSSITRVLRKPPLAEFRGPNVRPWGVEQTRNLKSPVGLSISVLGPTGDFLLLTVVSEGSQPSCDRNWLAIPIPGPSHSSNGFAFAPSSTVRASSRRPCSASNRDSPGPGSQSINNSSLLGGVPRSPNGAPLPAHCQPIVSRRVLHAVALARGRKRLLPVSAIPQAAASPEPALPCCDLRRRAYRL